MKLDDTQIEELENRIKRIESKGFEVSGLFDILNDLIEGDYEVQEEDTIIPVENSEDSLIKKIEQYEDYIRLREVFFSFDTFKKSEHTPEEISSMVKGILASFYALKAYYSSFPKFNEIYGVLYEIIKYEIKENQSSEILNTLSTFKYDVKELNKVIIRVVDNINDKLGRDFPEVSDMNLEFARCRKKENRYLCQELIEKIIECDETLTKVEENNETLETVKSTLESDIAIVTDKMNEIKIAKEKASNRRYASKKEFKKRLVSASLAGLLFGGVAVGGTLVSKSLSKQKLYLTTTQTYVEGKGSKEPITEYLPKREYQEDKILRIVNCSSIYSNSLVDIKEYRLNDIELDSIEDYLSFDVKHYGFKYTGVHYEEENTYLIELGEEYRELLLINQDLNISKDGENLFAFYGIRVLTGILCVLEAVLPKGLIERIKKLIVSFKELSTDSAQYESIKEEFLDVQKECLDIIKKSWNSQNSYYCVYERNDKMYYDNELERETREIVEKRKKLVLELGGRLDD